MSYHADDEVLSTTLGLDTIWLGKNGPGWFGKTLPG
jgi:hypothetical protein